MNRKDYLKGFGIGFLMCFLVSMVLMGCSGTGSPVSADAVLDGLVPIAPPPILMEMIGAIGAESMSRQSCWPFTKTAVEVEVGADRLATFRYDLDGKPGLRVVLEIRWSRWMQPKRYPLTLPAEGSFRYRYQTSGMKHIQYELSARDISDGGCRETKTVVIGEPGDMFDPELPPPTGCVSCEQADPQFGLEVTDGYRLTFRYSARCGYLFLATGAITQPWVGPLISSEGLVEFEYPRQSAGMEHTSRLAVVLDGGDVCYSLAVRVWIEP